MRSLYCCSLSPQQQPLCSDKSLLSAKKLPSSPGPPSVNPHTTTESEDATGMVRFRVGRKMSTPRPSGLNTPSATSPSVIVNPLPHLDPTHLMAALSSFSLVNLPTTVSPSHLIAALSSPGPSGLVNPSSAPSMSDSNPPPLGLQYGNTREGKDFKTSKGIHMHRLREAYD